MLLINNRNRRFQIRIIAYLLAFLYFVLLALDIVTENSWIIFSHNEIWWHNDWYRICDIVYSVTKSFVWLFAYFLLWVFFRWSRKIYPIVILWIMDYSSFNCIGLAFNNFIDMLTGGNFKQTPFRWIVFIVTIIITFCELASLFKRLKTR